jgi:hypothetical protein
MTIIKDVPLFMTLRVCPEWILTHTTSAAVWVKGLLWFHTESCLSCHLIFFRMSHPLLSHFSTLCGRTLLLTFCFQRKDWWGNWVSSSMGSHECFQDSQSRFCPISKLRFIMGQEGHSGLGSSAQSVTRDSGFSLMEETDRDWAKCWGNTGLSGLQLERDGQPALSVQLPFAQKRNRPHSALNVMFQDSFIALFRLYICRYNILNFI